MITLSIFDQAGNHVRTIQSDTATAWANVLGTERAFEGVDAEQAAIHYYDSGSDSLIPIPDRLNKAHQFDYTTKQWIDPRQTESLRSAAKALAGEQRTATESSGFTWDGSVFDSDPVSHLRIQGAALLATIATISSQPFSIDWTLADNTVRTLDGPSMIGAGQALAIHMNDAHIATRLVKAVIETETREELIARVDGAAP